LGEDEELKIGKCRVKTLHVPCHTKGHTIYSFLPQELEQESLPVDKSTIEGKPIRVF
jgi:hypothetical protein